jgi:succinate dehydrogenase / fumarate reductase, flavoprotein subunit
MTATCGILRDEPTLARGAAEIAALETALADLRVRDTTRVHNAELVRSFEAENMLAVAALTLAGARDRTESRGAHARRDHPARDDDRWLRHILVSRAADHIEKTYRPVHIDWTKHPPAARRY